MTGRVGMTNGIKFVFCTKLKKYNNLKSRFITFIYEWVAVEKLLTILQNEYLKDDY